MYGFFSLTGFRFPLTGTIVGIISGFGARALARGGDMTLGIVAAILSVLSVTIIMHVIYGGYFGFGIVAIFASGYFGYRFASY